MKYLLETVVEHNVKLTTAGYLPPRIVKQFYLLAIGETVIDDGLAKLSKEVDSNSVILARKICEMARLTKVRKGAMAATAKVVKIADNDAKLFKLLVDTFCQKIN